MLYRGTEVGCCAIMYEERKGGSKEASSKGNKQRQTGRCLPVALLNEGGGLLQENQHTPTHSYKHLAPPLSHTQHSKWGPGCSLAHIHTLSSGWKVCMYVWVCVCTHTWMHQCQCRGVGHCCLGPKRASVSHPSPPPPAHEEMGREHSSDVGKGQEEMRESEGGKENKKGTIEGEGLDSCLLPSLEASSSQS